MTKSDLRDKIIEEAGKRLKDGRIANTIEVPSKNASGDDIMEKIKVTDPEIWLDSSMKIYRFTMGLNDDALLELIARNLRISTTKTKEELIDDIETKIKDITFGSKGLFFKGKVLKASYTSITAKSNGKAYVIARLNVADETGICEVSPIFKSNDTQFIFDEIDANTLVGKNLEFANFKADANKYSSAQFTLQSGQGSTIAFSDTEIKVNTEFTPLSKINDATTIANIRGKISNIYSHSFQKGEKTGSIGTFTIVDKDGGTLVIKAWGDAALHIPDKGTVIEITCAAIGKDQYQIDHGNPRPYVTTINDIREIQVLSGKAAEGYPDRASEVQVSMKSIVEAQANATFDTIASIYDVRYTSWDSSEDADGNPIGTIEKDPYYIACMHSEGGKTCKSGCKANEDGTYTCKKGHEVDETMIEKSFMANANVHDGSMQYTIMLNATLIEEMLGIKNADLIADYERLGYKPLFDRINDELNGKKFRIRGMLKTDGIWGVKLQVRKITPIELTDYVKGLAESFS